MEEFMLHRRYCKFKNRKTKSRPKMNNEGDDAVTFKVKRFIKDIEKYSLLKKKKKARKEAKFTENHLATAANKGIYKNAVFSHPGIKALLSGSTIARLEGDLMSLSNKKRTVDKDIIKFAEDGINKTKETNNEKNSNVNQLLNSGIFEEDVADKETVSVNNNNVVAEIVEIRSNDLESIQNNRNSQDILENKEGDYDFIADEHPANRADISPVADCLRDVSQNASNEVMFPKAPSVNEEFFDLLNKTPENRNSQTFNLFNSPENNQWKDYNPLIYEKKKKVNIFNSVGIQTSLEPIKLPEEYIFKFQPENNSFNEEKLLKKDKQVEVNSDEFNLSFKGFHKKHHHHPKMHKNDNYNFKETFIKNYLSSPETLKNRKIMKSPIFKDFYKCYPQYHSSTSSSNDSLNVKKSPDFSLNEFKKFKNENLDFTEFSEPKFTKYPPQMCLKDDYNFKREIFKKDELNFKRRFPRLLPNSRFKTNLKFSPHKYC